MAQIIGPGGYRVELTEYERGQSGELVATLYFDNAAEARQFEIEYNNTRWEPGSPYWYLRAEYTGEV